MATLYVENIPDELYKALRQVARQQRSSIASVVVRLLEQNIATPSELRLRKKFLQRAMSLRSRLPLARKLFPSAEEMQREDRIR